MQPLVWLGYKHIQTSGWPRRDGSHDPIAAGGALNSAIAIYTRSYLIVVHLYRQLVGDGQLGNTTTSHPTLEPSTPCGYQVRTNQARSFSCLFLYLLTLYETYEYNTPRKTYARFKHIYLLLIVAQQLQFLPRLSCGFRASRSLAGPNP
jgi:hypothetical protein